MMIVNRFDEGNVKKHRKCPKIGRRALAGRTFWIKNKKIFSFSCKMGKSVLYYSQ